MLQHLLFTSCEMATVIRAWQHTIRACTQVFIKVFSFKLNTTWLRAWDDSIWACPQMWFKIRSKEMCTTSLRAVHGKCVNDPTDGYGSCVSKRRPTTRGTWFQWGYTWFTVDAMAYITIDGIMSNIKADRAMEWFRGYGHCRFRGGRYRRFIVILVSIMDMITHPG